MARGFSGKSVARFFKNTCAALDEAGIAHNRNPFEGVATNLVPLPTVVATNNVSAPFTAEDAWSDRMQARRVGNESNIVVDQQLYENIINRVDAIDDQAGADIYMMANAIEDMCARIFVVPETVNRILAITSQLKSSLGQFRSLTEDTSIDMRRFVNAISAVDHGNTKQLSMSDTGSEQAIRRVTSSVDRQVTNMERTASRYRLQSDNIMNSAEMQMQQIGGGVVAGCMPSGSATSSHISNAVRDAISRSF